MEHFAPDEWHIGAFIRTIKNKLFTLFSSMSVGFFSHKADAASLYSFRFSEALAFLAKFKKGKKS